MARTQASNTQASKSKSFIGFFFVMKVFQTTWVSAFVVYCRSCTSLDVKGQVDNEDHLIFMTIQMPSDLLTL